MDKVASDVVNEVVDDVISNQNAEENDLILVQNTANVTTRRQKSKRKEVCHQAKEE